MKKVENIYAPKIPKVKIDKSLNKYQGKILFKSTLDKAQEAMKNLKLPKSLKKQNEST